jgi:23S rRNA (adenine-N6)-dimethyltransferase
VAGKPPPQWGWHQLDRDWALRLVRDAAIRPGELVLDVGAGRGALTGPLLDCGARIIAIERHPERARYLRQRFGGAGVVVVQADAADLRLPRRPFRVLANPPFTVTQALLRRLTSPGSRLVTAHLVVPRHVVHRWTGTDAPAWARWSRVFSITPGAHVPRRAFHPPPPRDAAVLVIRRHQTPAPAPARDRRSIAGHRNMARPARHPSGAIGPGR